MQNESIMMHRFKLLLQFLALLDVSKHDEFNWLSVSMQPPKESQIPEAVHFLVF